MNTNKGLNKGSCFSRTTLEISLVINQKLFFTYIEGAIKMKLLSQLKSLYIVRDHSIPNSY